MGGRRTRRTESWENINAPYVPLRLKDSSFEVAAEVGVGREMDLRHGDRRGSKMRL